MGGGKGYTHLNDLPFKKNYFKKITIHCELNVD